MSGGTTHSTQHATRAYPEEEEEADEARDEAAAACWARDLLVGRLEAVADTLAPVRRRSSRQAAVLASTSAWSALASFLALAPFLTRVVSR
jgi:hypothetical protein